MKETNVHKAIRASFEKVYWRTSDFGPLLIGDFLRGPGVNLAIMRLGGADEFYVPARNFFAGFPLARGEP